MLNFKQIASLGCLLLLFVVPAHAQSTGGWLPGVKKSWSLSASVGQSLDNAGPLTSQFLRSDQNGGNYYLNRQVFALSHSFLSYSRHYEINNWLSANWNVSWSSWQLELKTGNVYVNNTSEGNPPGSAGFILTTIRGTTITGLSLTPGVQSHIPIGKNLWMLGGLQSGAMYHKGSLLTFGNKAPTESLDRAGVRWQNIVEAGIELQPFPKSQEFNLFCTYQFVHLSKGNNPSEWAQFQNFSQFNFGVRVAAKPRFK